jgi:hypothetical protein
MKGYKGTVKGGVIVLDAGTHLPEGMEVVVREREMKDREAALLKRLDRAVRRILAHQIKHPVGMDEIIQECKRELEERVSFSDNAPP